MQRTIGSIAILAVLAGCPPRTGVGVGAGSGSAPGVGSGSAPTSDDVPRTTARAADAVALSLRQPFAGGKATLLPEEVVHVGDASATLAIHVELDASAAEVLARFQAETKELASPTSIDVEIATRGETYGALVAAAREAGASPAKVPATIHVNIVATDRTVASPALTGFMFALFTPDGYLFDCHSHWVWPLWTECHSYTCPANQCVCGSLGPGRGTPSCMGWQICGC